MRRVLLVLAALLAMAALSGCGTPKPARVGGCGPILLHRYGCAPTPPSGPTVNYFVAQSSAGAGDGTSCANAEPVSTLSTATHWTPGNVIGLCGTITGSAGATIISAQGSGTSGNPITVYWEPGASLQAPYCGGHTAGCLSTAGNSYITLNGGQNGSILSTQNGTGLTFQVGNVYGVHADSCTGCTIENLTVGNMYNRTSTTDTEPLTSGFPSGVLNISGSNWTVTNNTFYGAQEVDIEFGNGDANDVWSGNNEYSLNHAFNSIGPPGGTVGPIFFFGNHLHEWSTWDDTTGADAYHHDGIHCFTPSGTTATYTAFYAYDNRFDASYGSTMNSPIFLEGAGNGTGCAQPTSPFYVFNNVFEGDEAAASSVVSSAAAALPKVFDNTLVDTASGSLCASLFGGLNENNAYSCPQLLQNGANCTGCAQINYSALDDNIYDSGGSLAWEYGTGTFATFTSTGFSSWKSAMGNLDAHSCAIDDGGFSGAGSCTGNPTSLSLNSDGSPQAGSPVLGAGGNLTSTCASLPTTPVNVQAACETTYTGPPSGGGAGSSTAGSARPASGAWNVGAY